MPGIDWSEEPVCEHGAHECDECPQTCVHGLAECADCDAYAAYQEQQWAEMCPVVRDLMGGYDDPITQHYGAGGLITDIIVRHTRTCTHAWCVAEREGGL